MSAKYDALFHVIEKQSAHQCVEHLAETMIKCSTIERPTAFIFKDPTIGFKLHEVLGSEQRWNKLCRDYLGDEGREFMSHKLKKRGDTYSFTPAPKDRHERGDCFLGMVASTRPHRVMMFSRRCRVMPTGILDLQVLCCAVKALNAEYGMWVLNSYFTEKASLYPLLRAMGWSDKKVRGAMSPSDRRMLDGAERGDFTRAYQKRLHRHLNTRQKMRVCDLQVA